ncbi:MAG: hypothetical protein LBB45_08660 [Methanobrevibacter sp.]|jgi:hypothetical protein|nr:hypothetical protein [Candidatus Methanovirga basalitermitum]
MQHLPTFMTLKIDLSEEYSSLIVDKVYYGVICKAYNAHDESSIHEYKPLTIKQKKTRN